MSGDGADRLRAGREALQHHAWHPAFEALYAADTALPLTPTDLELLGEAAQWVGRLDQSIAAYERAHARYLEQGNRRRAGFMAVQVAHGHFARAQRSLGSGWLRRAERLLDSEQDSIEYGHLLRARGLNTKDPDEALANARAAHALATRFGDRDLAARELQEQGRLLVAKGDVAEGLALIEEAAAIAVSGELGPLATGDIYCNAIDVCRRLADYRRAGEWTDAARQWCDREGILGVPGVCRVSRASILRLRGALTDAAGEAAKACEELRPYDLGATAEAFYELAEIRLRLGHLAAAEEAFRQAHQLGRDPQPGLSLLRLAEGKVDAARNAIKSALADDSRDRLAAPSSCQPKSRSPWRLATRRPRASPRKSWRPSPRPTECPRWTPRRCAREARFSSRPETRSARDGASAAADAGRSWTSVRDGRAAWDSSRAPGVG